MSHVEATKITKSEHAVPVELSETTVDVDSIIMKNPCAGAYADLEDCLFETNRSWQKCQAQA